MGLDGARSSIATNVDGTVAVLAKLRVVSAGEDAHHHLEHIPRPRADLEQEALARRAAFLEGMHAAFFEGAKDQPSATSRPVSADR